MKPSLGIFIVILISICTSCITTEKNTDSVIDPKKLAFISEHCFEIVILKPETDLLTYEKPLDWSQLSQTSRNDKYYSIGTAFAIGPRELVTAAHVVDINNTSLVYTDYFVRIKKRVNGITEEKVYKIDQLHSYHNRRDYVVFTCTDLSFTTWLPVSNEIEFNTRIYTAGNAYGEGVVVREGILLDEIDEAESGEWKYLKSSIATNPGNSGGPLLNNKLEVIGIVLQKKDDFCYSLKMGDIIQKKAIFHYRATYGLTVFNNKIIDKKNNEFSLPASYTDIQKKIHIIWRMYYEAGMANLIKTHKDDIFPNGENSLKALYNARTTIFPQMLLQDSNDKTWFVSNINPTSSDLGKNGKLYWGEVYKDSRVMLMRIDHPDDVNPSEYIKEPKLIMDHILKGIASTRKLSESDPGTRIISLGNPIKTDTYTDVYTRKWHTAIFQAHFSDRIIITFSLPTPQGVSVLYVSANSKDLEAWYTDLKILSDFVINSYFGEVGEWKVFLEKSENLVPALQELSLTYEKDKEISLSHPQISITLPSEVISITERTELMLVLDVFPKADIASMDIRRISFADPLSDNNFISLYRWLEPDARLPQEYTDEWTKSIINRTSPYNNLVQFENSKTYIGAILPIFIENDATKPLEKTVFSVYISKDGTQTQDTMKSLLSSFSEKIIIK